MPKQTLHPAKKIRGFSLIEIMVVIVIVGILAAFAIPSYQKSVRRAERSDGRAAVLNLQNLQERYYFNNNRYGTIGELTGAPALASDDGHYDITMTLTANNESYEISAVRSKNIDPECHYINVNSIGITRAFDFDGNVTSPEICWKK